MTALGRVDDAVKERALRDADVLCAPSLGGESFGMVLTEAFAAGTPVVASDIAGYRDVVTDGVDGVLVPRGDATALAEALRDLALDPARNARLARRRRAQAASRYAWPRVAESVVERVRGRACRAGARGRGAARRGAGRRACRPTCSRGCRRGGCRRWSPVAEAARWRCGAALMGVGRRWRSRPARCWPSSTSGCRGSAMRWCAPRRRGCCSGSR